MNQPTPDPFESFDPNNPDLQKLWGCYVGGRFRTFGSRGPALQAVHRSRECKLFYYDAIQGRWVEVARKYGKSHENCPTTCVLCQQSTMDHPSRWDYQTRTHIVDTTRRINLGEFRFVRKNAKVVDPLKMVFACEPCRIREGL